VIPVRFVIVFFVCRVEPKRGPAGSRKAAEEEGCVASQARRSRAERARGPGRPAAPGSGRDHARPAAGAGKRGDGTR